MRNRPPHYSRDYRRRPHSIERGKAQWERWWGIDIEESVAQYQLEQGAECRYQ